jgi:isopentenyl phosphate kinase
MRAEEEEEKSNRARGVGDSDLTGSILDKVRKMNERERERERDNLAAP